MKPRISLSAMTILFVTMFAGLVPPCQSQTLTVLHTFTGTPDGANPMVGVVRDGAGNLYGTTLNGGSAGFGTVYKLSPGGKETVLYSFKGTPDGQNPYAGGLVRDSSGNLYGTTEVGGTASQGTVYRVDHLGNETLLYSFTGGTDGGIPYAGVIRDSAGNLYGTTYFGGGTHNYGTVYKVDTAGNETLLRSFSGPPTDGKYSYGGLVRDAQGNLYGTNYEGGFVGGGTVFKLAPNGNYKLLHSFKRNPDGQLPFAGLTLSQGNFYGTTISGGTFGFGTVYKLNNTGSETVLYSFSAGADGGLPNGGLVLDSAGNIYGTTYLGGAFGYGTVFRLDPSGNETVLYSFTGGADGKNPYFVVLLRDNAGNLYGTTSAGGGSGCGGSGCGTIFKLTP